MKRPTRTVCRVPLLALLLAALCLAPVSGWTASPPKKIAPALQPFVNDHVLAGAVTLVADKNNVLDLEAVGWMDIAAKKKMQTDCLFWIASQSKPITAAALMILVDGGKVSVDDLVEKYLPEFKDQWLAVEQGKDQILLKKPKHPITVKNILSHTSGMPFKSALEQPTLDLFPLAVRVGSYAMTPLQFEPDTKYQYSNAGINTAGRIIEVVSGLKYETFLDQRIFKPLGMKDTTTWPSKTQLKRLAKAYKPAKDGLEECPIAQLRYPLNDRERQPMPAGGFFSTATDLSCFYRMLANNGEFRGKRVLSEQAVRQMTSKQTGDLPTPYGFGFAVGGGKIGHGGAYSTSSSYDTERGLITVFLVQHAGWAKNGKEVLPAFQKAAAETFGK